MARHQIVISDPDVAHAKEIERNVKANTAHLSEATPLDVRLTANKQIEKVVRDRIGPKRAVGAVHDEADDACPEGLPNCRNCGDPSFEASCAAAGHCQNCGRTPHSTITSEIQLSPPFVNGAPTGGHGIAPDSVLAANGYALKRV